jgi:hypothetical protein
MAAVTSACVIRPPTSSPAPPCHPGRETAEGVPGEAGDVLRPDTLSGTTVALVEGSDDPFQRTEPERQAVQDGAPLRPGSGGEGAVRPDKAVEVVDDGRAVHEDLAVIQDKGRHPPERIVPGDLGALVCCTQGQLLEGRP